MTSITELRNTLISLPSPPDDGSGRAVLDRLDELRVLRNVLDHQIAAHIALLDASGAAARAGSTTRAWLVEMGMPPGVAHRGVRIAAGLGALPKVADCAAEGYLVAECVDAVVRGIAFIDKQAAAPLSDDERSLFESELLAQVFSGATPAEITTHARTIALRVAGTDTDPNAVAAADDASLNTVHTRVTDEGRVAITADVTAVIGEKFLTMIDERSCPRPEPDGAEDRRDVAQRRALLLPEVRAKRASKGVPTRLTGPFVPRRFGSSHLRDQGLSGSFGIGPVVHRVGHNSTKAVMRWRGDRDRPRQRRGAVTDGNHETTVPASPATSDHRAGRLLCEMRCPRSAYASPPRGPLG